MYCGGGRREAMSNREVTSEGSVVWCNTRDLVEGRGRWARTRTKKNVAALGMCERGKGLRELRKTGNVKNMAYHHNHVSACKREKKLLL